MKSKLLSLIILSSSMVLPAMANAQVLFDENFDGALYQANANLNDVAGWGVLQHGRWTVHHDAISTSAAQSLSPGQSMQMEGTNSQFLGIFGVDGSAATPTHNAMEIGFAFYLGNAQSTVDFVVRDEDGVNIAIVSIGGGNANIRGLFSSGFQTTGSLESGTWYNLKLGLSANPGSGDDQFSVSLFGADGVTQIGATITGSFYSASAGSGYSYMTAIFDGGSSGTDLAYLDNLTAQAIPEGSEVLYLALGGAICFGALRRGRFLKASV